MCKTRLICQVLETHAEVCCTLGQPPASPCFPCDHSHSAWETHRCSLVLHMAGTDRGQGGDALETKPKHPKRKAAALGLEHFCLELSLPERQRERSQSPEKCQRERGVPSISGSPTSAHRARNLLVSAPQTPQLLLLHEALPKTLSHGHLRVEQKGLWTRCQKPLVQALDLHVM